MAEPLQPPNHPIWADLASPDLEASTRFYGELFGWEAEQVAPPEAGTYTMLKLNGKIAAAVQTTMDGQMPPVWRAYIHSTDAAATTQAAREAGATIFMDAMDVFESGRLAMFADPTGAAIGLWQPKEMAGAEVMFEPGSIGWFELATRDMDAAKAFYKTVFGWDSKTSEDPQMPYTEFQLGGRSIAGGMPMQASQEGMPPYWFIYFASADADASASRVQELGGSIMVPPMDFPGGRFAIAGDANGTMFGLMTMRE